MYSKYIKIVIILKYDFNIYLIFEDDIVFKY